MSNTLVCVRQYLLKYPVAFLILACIVTRLPQLLSPNLFLDPDECVTATMAKYLIEGKDYSLYFWGQDFGITILENLFIIPFYLVLGINTLSVKLGMLSLWTVGAIFLYKTILAISGRNISSALILTLLFICLPAWAVWSMKARGGYLTSFTLSTIFTFLLYDARFNMRIWVWILLGILLQLIYESQLLWLIGVLPLMVYALTTQKKIKHIIAFFVSLAVFFYLFSIYKGNSGVTSNRLTIPDLKNIWTYFDRFPDYLYCSFQGHYYFSTFFPPDPASAVCAALSVLLIAGLLILSLKELFLSKNKNYRFIFSTLFIPGFYLFSLFMVNKEGRYFLPVTGFSLLSLSMFISSKNIRFSWRLFSILPIICGLAALNSFWYFQFEGDKEKSITALVHYLKEKKIKYCFSMDCMLPWHLIFYSDEAIIARIPFMTDRYQKFHSMVDSNFLEGGKTAVIGYRVYESEYVPRNAVYINEFFIEENPDKQKIIDNFNPQKK